MDSSGVTVGDYPQIGTPLSGYPPQKDLHATPVLLFSVVAD